MAGGNEQFHRLGKRELGPWAFEEAYPRKIAAALEQDGKSNFVAGVIPNLAKLLQNNRDVAIAYLCTESASQVWKAAEEGSHFCGYHNIQIICMALAASGIGNSKAIPERPSIPQLQSLIEQAWDRGFNPHGRILTGGIKGTRKHIGTSEAEALFLSHDVQCTGRAFEGKDAWLQLINAVQEYYTVPASDSEPGRVKITRRMPIFLQRPGHSITIVGFMRSNSGQCRLLTFDPAWQPPTKMATPLKDATCTGLSAILLLKRYRKSQVYFKRYRAFEILEIDEPK